MASQNRHYVNIEERAYTPDGEGGHTEGWSVVSGYTNVPVGISPLSAFRKEEYRTFDIDATHEIKVRGEIAIVEKNNRIVWGSKIYEVKTVEDIQERQIEQNVICLERRV
jgi:head-tail adaptor